jgi:hypothetical protein
MSLMTDTRTLSPGMIDIDLTPYRIPKPPLWKRREIIPVWVVAYAFLMIGPMLVRSPLGAPIFVVLLVVLIVGAVGAALYGMPKILKERASSSVIGRKLDFLRPQDLEAVPPHFDLPLGAIVQRLKSLADEGRKDVDAPPPARIIPPRTRMHANAYAVGAGAVAVAWLLLMLVGVGGMLPTLLMLLLSGALLTRRRRVLAKGADVALQDDGRPPVLFLRSFKDDSIKLNQYQRWFGLAGLQKIRFEEALAEMVGPYGPLLAVGEPSEGLPQLGAARAYLSDDAWQGQVQSWIAQSRMIAMLCGPTRWVHWEMQNIVAAQRLGALLLFLPPGRKPAGEAARRRLERWDNIVSSLATTPYGAAMRALDIKDVLLIHFTAIGGLTVFRSQGDTAQDYDLAAALAAYTILTEAPTALSAAPLPTAPTIIAPDLAPGAHSPSPLQSSGGNLSTALKFAGVAAAVFALRLILGRLELGGLARTVLSFTPFLALAITAAGAFFWTRRSTPLWRLFGLLFAGGLAQTLLFRAAIHGGSFIFMHPSVPLLLLIIAGVALTAGVPALGERRLRWLFSPPGLGILALRVVLQFAGFLLRASPLATLISVVEGALFAGLVGYSLSRSPPP